MTSTRAAYLKRIGTLLRRSHVRIGRLMWPAQDPAKAASAAGALGRFALSLSAAIPERLAGRIQAAVKHERQADSIYRTLPSFARDMADGLENGDEPIKIVAKRRVGARSEPSHARRRAFTPSGGEVILACEYSEPGWYELTDGRVAYVIRESTGYRDGDRVVAREISRSRPALVDPQRVRGSKAWKDAR